MNPQDKTPPRESFGFLSHRRAVPVVETPARWPFVVGGLFLLAGALAALAIASA